MSLAVRQLEKFVARGQNTQRAVDAAIAATLVLDKPRVPEIKTLVVTISPGEETKFIRDLGFLEAEVTTFVTSRLCLVSSGPIPNVEATFYKKERTGGHQ